MKYVIILGDIQHGISEVVGPFDTRDEAEGAEYDLGFDVHYNIIYEMETEDDYRSAEVCSS